MEIFHYTSIDAAQSIICGHSFRATNMRDLDDKQELFGGLNPLCASMQDLQNKCGLNGLSTFSLELGNGVLNTESNSFFAISFCKRNNYDFMWEHYAPGDGCCIAFDKEKLLWAFNNVCFPYDSQCHPLRPITEFFIPCKYFFLDEMLEESRKYLNNIEIQEEVNGIKSISNFCVSKPCVYTQTITSWNDLENPSVIENQPTIDLIDASTRILAFALCVKQKGTDCEFEKEDEERLVFFPPTQYPFKLLNAKNRLCIEIRLNPVLFLQSINRIQLSRTCKNPSVSATNFQQTLAPIYERYGVGMPAIVEDVSPLK